jgi:hypothetical protein
MATPREFMPRLSEEQETQTDFAVLLSTIQMTAALLPDDQKELHCRLHANLALVPQKFSTLA